MIRLTVLNTIRRVRLRSSASSPLRAMWVAIAVGFTAFVASVALARSGDAQRADASFASARIVEANSVATRVVEASPVRGIVRDAQRHTPLAAYAIDVRGGTTEERATTDSKGHFTTLLPFEPGPVTIHPVDHAATTRAVSVGGLTSPAPVLAAIEKTWAADAPEIEIDVDIGPVFDVTFTLAEATPPDSARAPATLDGAIARLEAFRDESVDEGASLETIVRVTDGNSWVRFAPLTSELFASPRRARLVVFSRDGFWRAETDVTKALAAQPSSVALAWQPCARWLGRIRGPHGELEPLVWLTLTRLGPDGQALERRRVRADTQGDYAFDALTPGTWQLNGRPLRFQEFSSLARVLAARAESKLNVTLEKTRIAGDLKGRIEGPPASAARPLETNVILRRGGEPLPMESATATWRVEGDRWLGVFTFPGLPGDHYLLELVPPAGDEAHFATLSIAAKAPSEDVVFTRKAL